MNAEINWHMFDEQEVLVIKSEWIGFAENGRSLKWSMLCNGCKQTCGGISPSSEIQNIKNRTKGHKVRFRCENCRVEKLLDV